MSGRLAKHLVSGLLAALLLGGCATVIEGGAEKVSVDTGDLGHYAPGIRAWIGWLKANEHCAAFGRKPVLADLAGRTASYRCVVEKAEEAGKSSNPGP
jgi:hypothetical protein